MNKKKELTPEELEQQADAILAAADAAQEEDAAHAPEKGKKKSASKKAERSESHEGAGVPVLLTDEEAK